jgi:hypothetical protein
MPPGWRSVILYWAPNPGLATSLLRVMSGEAVDRNIVLCPHHAAEIKQLLEPLDDHKPKQSRHSAQRR